MTEKEAVPEFQSKNPGISVEIQFVPEAEIQQKLLAAKAANNAPDVTAIDETFEDTLWKNKALLPIPASVMDVRKEMGAKVGDLYKLPPVRRRASTSACRTARSAARSTTTRRCWPS